MKPTDISVTPVKKYAAPKYPTIADAQCAPLLLKKLPSRWEKNAKVVAAVGMIGAITLTSCGVFEPKIRGYSPASKNYLNVAPVFVHGEGTGYMGCVMIVPPVFLSEQEALAVIKNEAENSGLKFNAEPPEYIATSNKKTYEKKYSWDRVPDDHRLGNGEVGLDFYDNRKGVAVSYISMEKGQATTETWHGRSIEELLESPPLSWTSYPRELAELTAEDFAKQHGNISIGVFYEPGWLGVEEQERIIEEYRAKSREIENIYFNAPYYDEANGMIFEEYQEEVRKKCDEACREYEEKIKLSIEENLRAQVRDFIEWLQGQGII